ncbi:unnamed protein product, partial [Sphagnum balticum]
MPRGRPKKIRDEEGEAKSETDFIVEKICDKRYVKGKTQYLIKWKGYASSENTWEPEDNLDCIDLVAEFEEDRKKMKEDSGVAEKRTPRRAATRGIRYGDEDEDITSRSGSTSKTAKGGFEKGLRPERIMGATDVSGELMFLMKWVDSDDADLVSAKICNVRCPQLIDGNVGSSMTGNFGRHIGAQGWTHGAGRHGLTHGIGAGMHSGGGGGAAHGTGGHDGAQDAFVGVSDDAILGVSLTPLGFLTTLDGLPVFNLLLTFKNCLALVGGLDGAVLRVLLARDVLVFVTVFEAAKLLEAATLDAAAVVVEVGAFAAVILDVAVVTELTFGLTSVLS